MADSDVEVVDQSTTGVWTAAATVVGRMLAVLNVPADKLNLNAGDKPGKKRGRPPNPINDYFTNKVFDNTQFRRSVYSNNC